jgi:hypothetical protein
LYPSPPLSRHCSRVVQISRSRNLLGQDSTTRWIDRSVRLHTSGETEECTQRREQCQRTRLPRPRIGVRPPPRLTRHFSTLVLLLHDWAGPATDRRRLVSPNTTSLWGGRGRRSSSHVPCAPPESLCGLAGSFSRRWVRARLLGELVVRETVKGAGTGYGHW